MPQRQNLKPALADTLRSLRNDVQSGATVPHGVKTVQPGEGLQLLSPEGAEIFWDWETANDYETRIQEGRAAIEQARADLDKAEQDLAAGAARVDENRALLDALVPRVDAAESTVEQATRDLTAVSGRLDTTAGDLTTLQGTVGDVSAKAAELDQKASEALAKAGVAQRSADGKNTIVSSVNPPSGAGVTVGDLHRQFTSLGSGGSVSREWRWDGSTWVEQTLSGDMVTNLDVGKLTGVFANISQHLQARSIGAEKLLVGVGQNLIANPNGVGTPDPHNAYSGGVKSGVDGATSGTVFYTASTAGSWGNAMLLGSGVTTANGRAGDFNLDPRSEYVFRMRVRKTSGTGSARVRLSVYNMAGSALRNIFSPDTPVTTAWAPIEVRLSGSDLAGGVSGGISIQTTRDGEYQYEGLDFREMTNGALIVNGSITGEKVEAQSVAAKVGQFVKVQAVNVEVTGDLATRVVNAMTTQTKNLVVTESAVLQHTTLLGTTVADQLNVRKLLRGRDAILSGTVDVGQLNVTGAMSAEIVNAMTTQTKQLVVTEDAILNRATVVEGLVTSELISKKANIGDLAARMITSGLLQTTTAANRGVKIDNAGIRAWDDTGQQTIRLNGADNLVQGTFQTGTTGSRIKINAVNTTAFMDLYGNSGGLDHGTIYYDAAVPGKTDAALTLTAIKDYSANPENPSFRLFPTRGTFAFQGRWASETDPIKFMVIQNDAGLPANAYNTFKIAYSYPFPTKSAIRFPLLSVESENGADIMATIVAQTEKDITINAVNKSGGKASGRIIIKLVTFNTDNTQA